jgi:hypothetical protein
MYLAHKIPDDDHPDGKHDRLQQEPEKSHIVPAVSGHDLSHQQCTDNTELNVHCLPERGGWK